MQAFAQNTTPTHTVYKGADAERLALATPNTFDIFVCEDTGDYWRYVGGWGKIAENGVFIIDSLAPIGSQPVNVEAPEASGRAVVGETLTCSTGIWTGTAPITYAYKWFQGNTPIIGANTNTYIIQAGDLASALHCIVTATNTIGVAEASSNLVLVVVARYNYRSNAGIPAAGMISAGSAGAPLQLRISETDLDGVNHSGAFLRLGIGDSILVNNQVGVITDPPIYTSGYFIFEVDVWPVMPDGEVIVKLDYGNA